ncbi:Hypothetical protein SRAE_1000172100 [Strongyloides ratti]|uniref:Very-long-chain 3-oxoacyl-CoA synthase n=1 Tax=Strongyloides ratti TaxID=34506 RepID=A0A090L7F6_STRRB|nr:Hypothetical protein SRAE_1000172100 [Strongyloides ratti]CEF63459.1 Hypothetical protein SRAE_1000172100 [Strongyloides ratti]
MIYGVWATVEFSKFIRFKSTDIDSDNMEGDKKKIELVGLRKTNLALQKMFLFDCFASMVYAIIILSFPGQILKFTLNKPGNLDSFHKLYCRYFGAYMLYSVIMSAAAVSLNPRQQKFYAIQRAITQTITFVIHIYGHWSLGIYSPNHITPFMISGFYITFILSIYFRVKSRDEESNDEEIEYFDDNEDDSTIDNVVNYEGKLKTN